MPHTPTIVLAIAGGLLIGTAAGLLLVLSGRIAGVSGLAAAALRIADRGPPWLLAASFTFGLPLGATVVGVATGHSPVFITSSVPLLLAGGLLVGFGTRMGNGCTSGHGVCGLARLSPRSVAATATFIAAGVGTVFLIRHVLGAA